MGRLHVWIGIFGAIGFYTMGRPILLGLQIILTVAVWWTFGIMHNYAVDSAKRRPNYSGGSHDFTERDLDAVPNGLARANMIVSLASLILTFTAIGMAVYSRFIA